MFIGMIIAIYQLYCVQGRVAIPVKNSCYYTIVVRQEHVITIGRITNCIHTHTPPHTHTHTHTHIYIYIYTRLFLQ